MFVNYAYALGVDLKPIALDFSAALALAPIIEYVGRVCLVMVGRVDTSELESLIS